MIRVPINPKSFFFVDAGWKYSVSPMFIPAGLELCSLVSEKSQEFEQPDL